MRFIDNYAVSDSDTIESVEKEIAHLDQQICRLETTLRYLKKEQHDKFQQLLHERCMTS